MALSNDQDMSVFCCWPWLCSDGAIMNKLGQTDEENIQKKENIQKEKNIQKEENIPKEKCLAQDFKNTLEQKLIIAQEISKKGYVINAKMQSFLNISQDLQEKGWQKIYEKVMAKGVIVKSPKHVKEIWKEMRLKAVIHHQQKKMNELDRFIAKIFEDQKKHLLENLSLYGV